MVSIIKTTTDTFQKELAIDILWNLSVHYDLKSFILTETLDTLVEFIIIPECKMTRQSGGNYVPLREDLNWSIMLRNALGIIRLFRNNDDYTILVLKYGFLSSL